MMENQKDLEQGNISLNSSYSSSSSVSHTGSEKKLENRDKDFFPSVSDISTDLNDTDGSKDQINPTEINLSGDCREIEGSKNSLNKNTSNSLIKGELYFGSDVNEADVRDECTNPPGSSRTLTFQGSRLSDSSSHTSTSGSPPKSSTRVMDEEKTKPTVYEKLKPGDLKFESHSSSQYPNYERSILSKSSSASDSSSSGSPPRSEFPSESRKSRNSTSHSESGSSSSYSCTSGSEIGNSSNSISSGPSASGPQSCSTSGSENIGSSISSGRECNSSRSPPENRNSSTLSANDSACSLNLSSSSGSECRNSGTLSGRVSSPSQLQSPKPCSESRNDSNVLCKESASSLSPPSKPQSECINHSEPYTSSSPDSPVNSEEHQTTVASQPFQEVYVIDNEANSVETADTRKGEKRRLSVEERTDKKQKREKRDDSEKPEGGA